jgi:hypothetical protein
VPVAKYQGSGNAVVELVTASPPQGSSNPYLTRVLSAINRERARRGLGAAELMDEVDALDSAARGIRAGAEPHQAFQNALERLAETESSDVRGWVTEVADLRNIAVPEVFVAAPEVVMAVAVAPPNDSSISFVICYVLFEGGYSPDVWEG